MRIEAGQTYRKEWRRLAEYLHEQWPGIRAGNTVDTAMHLLEHLRVIEGSGILPAVGDDGQVVAGLSWEAMVE